MEDPAALTLGEALAAAPGPATLVWGRGLAGLGRQALALPGLRLFTSDLPTASALAGRGEIGVRPAPGPERRWALRVPPSREELELMVATAAARLRPGDELWIGGHKRDGIRSAGKRLGVAFGPAAPQRIKRHCQVLVATRTEAPGPDEPALEALEARFELTLEAGPLTVVTLPGVFAHGRLDQGTARLVELLQREPPTFSRALDLGCGCGVLGALLARLRPTARVALCDVSALACRAAERTLAINGLSERAEVRLLDAAEAASLGSADLVVVNPPFHHGRAADRSLVQPFVAAAAAAVARGGELLLVANRHLPYGDDLAVAFAKVDVAAEDGRFRVWRARRPRG